jgi:hypothetical protein
MVRGPVDVEELRPRARAVLVEVLRDMSTEQWLKLSMPLAVLGGVPGIAAHVLSVRRVPESPAVAGRP